MPPTEGRGFLERVMHDGERVRSRFFQDAAAAFLKLRGAPFILSARELHVLSSWEKEDIPLEAVLQGLEQAFQSLRRKSPSERGRVSLSFCDPFVRRVQAQARERNIGGRPADRRLKARKESIRREAEAFLRELPEELAYLQEFFRRALSLVEEEGNREAELAGLEGEVKEALESHCPAEERERARRQVRQETPSLSPAGAAAAVRSRLIKNLRERYRVPFVSYPYY